jgi:hypothetical protein
MKKTLLVALAAIALFFIVYEKYQDVQEDESFKVALDSLHKQNDSLLLSIDSKSVVIDSLEAVDSLLIDKLEHQKPKIVTITKFVDSSKKAIDTYSEQELISSLNTRYPEDTITNLLALAQPVLQSAAKDLIEFDGAKETITIQDSVISIQQLRLDIKEGIINEHIAKEKGYIKVLGNKNLEIKTWNEQYEQVKAENKKLKKKSKIQKIVSSAAIGALTIWLLVK